MKKNILAFCALCSFVINVYAQTSYNDCLKTARLSDGEWTKKSATNYLAGTLDKKTVSNISFKNKMNEIKNIFLGAYPVPKAVVGEYWLRSLNEISYSLQNGGKFTANAPQPYLFSNWFSPLKCSKDGVLSKKFTEAIAHYECNIFVNTLNPYLDWTKPIAYFTEGINATKYPQYKNIYCIPPHDNFEETKSRTNKDAIISNADYGTNADKYFSFRNVTSGYGIPGANYLDEYSETVLMSYNGKFPYTALTQKELFEVIELYIKNDIEKTNTYLQKPNEYESNKINWRKQIVGNENKLKQVAILKEYFKSSLNEPATVNRYYKNWRFIIDDIDKEKIKTLFIKDVKNGFTYSIPNTTFFKSTKIEDIQLLCISWYSKKFAGSNASNNIKPNSYPLLDYGLTDAMKIMDWDKLAALLTN